MIKDFQSRQNGVDPLTLIPTLKIVQKRIAIDQYLLNLDAKNNDKILSNLIQQYVKRIVYHDQFG